MTTDDFANLPSIPLNQGEFKSDNNREYHRLAGEVEASVGILSLFVAACDDLVLREKIIRQYEQEFQPEIRAYRVQLTRGEPSLRAAVATLVRQEEYLQQSKPAVITVLGAEELLFISSQGERPEVEKFFGYLQWTREGLREFPHPIVLWVTNQILVNLSEKAPDFWSWRKGVFRFVPETPVGEILPVRVESQVYSSSEETDDNFLPLEDLQDLIARTEQQKGTKNPKLGTLYKRLGQLYQRRLERGETKDDAKERELAFACFRKAIKLQTQFCLQSDLVGSLIGLGLLNDSLARYREAMDCYQKSLELAREVSDRNGEASCLGNLGSAYYSLGQYREAIAFCEQSLAIQREIGARNGEASCLGNLGNAYQSLGQYREAIAFYEQSLAIQREIGDRNGEAASLNNLGNAYNRLGQYREAIAFCEQSLAIQREIDDRNGEANSLNNLGAAYNFLGQYREAIALHEQSLAIQREIGDRNGEASSLNNLGNAYQSLGQYRKAIAFHEQSLAIQREIGDRAGEANSLNNLGRALAKLDRKWEAVQAYQKARNLFQAMGLKHRVEQCDAAIQDISMVVAAEPIIVPPFQPTPRKRRRRTLLQRIRRWLQPLGRLLRIFFRQR